MERENEAHPAEAQAGQRKECGPEWWVAECVKSRSWIEDDIAEIGRSSLNLDQRRLIALVNWLADVPGTKVLVAFADALEALGGIVGVSLPDVEAEISRRRRLFRSTAMSED